MGRTVMIVGNGETGKEAARMTGEADLVVRFNTCRSAGEYAARTDIVAVCNTGRPGRDMLGGRDWKDHPAVAAASEIWGVRDPAKFAEMKTPLAVSHPYLDDFCDDYTDGFRAFAQETGKGFHVVSREIHDGLDAALPTLSPAPYVTPSTGLIVIAEFIQNRLQEGDRIALAGFSHTGWEWHPWEAERLYIEPHEASGLVMRLQ
jgi:hypothetical protein